VARRAADKGRLIAVEGTRGREVQAAAADVWRRFRIQDARGGISRWDASGIFSELRLGKRRHLSLSPRPIGLLYAADLAFRLRWEIRPALDQGQVIVAAPYVETAVAFGVATGLPLSWLTRLFGFAPPPDACYRIKETRKASGKMKRSDGVVEFGLAVLADVLTPADLARTAPAMVAHLEELERANRCSRLTRRVISAQRL
jgi:thymidylate kinase